MQLPPLLTLIAKSRIAEALVGVLPIGLFFVILYLL
jgi:hypothetical protein